MQNQKALVVFSGGQDSTTCLFWAKQNFKEVHAVTFNYGQRHSRELDAARQIALLAGVASHEFVDVGPVLRGTSPLVSDSQLEQYDNWGVLPGGLEKTFVPGRNILFLTLAGNRAYCLGADAIVTGICEEDFGGYPDCREQFRVAMEDALYNGLDKKIEIIAPLMYKTKKETVEMALEMSFHDVAAWNALAFSHTAYDGQYPPVGKDHATLLRAKGFEQANLPDPLVLRAWSEGLMELPNSSNYTEYIRSWGDRRDEVARNFAKCKDQIFLASAQNIAKSVEETAKQMKLEFPNV
jgi:7-cyano-7-deazaguanine synthase